MFRTITLGLMVALLQTGTAVAQAPTKATETPEYKRGRLLYIQCRACHDLKAGLPHKVGPNLNGIFGRKAGAAPGFTLYSAALKSWGQTWDATNMDQWIAKPSAVVPGNGMAFAGLASAKDRAALIGYVQVESAPSPK
jgi:cytochrome c